MKANKRNFVNFTLHLLAILLSTLPPAIATLSYFPLWRGRGGLALLSGGAVLLLSLSAVPLFKLIAAKIRSASSFVMWGLILLLFLFLGEISRELTVISFFGFLGNLFGALLFKIAARGDDDG